MKNELYAEVIIPLAVRGRFSYRVPEHLQLTISTGSRVVVGFGNRRLYSAVVCSLTENDPGIDGIKDVIDILDSDTVISTTQIKFWNWIADYYMCTPGEVMKAAMPSGLCLESETTVTAEPGFSDFKSLDEESYLLFNQIENKKSISIRQLPQKLNGRNTLKIVNELVNRKALLTGETIVEKYRAKMEPYLILSRKYTDDELNKILDSLAKAPGQLRVLVSYLKLTDYFPGSDLFPVKKKWLLKDSGALTSSLSGLLKKGILVLMNLEVSRIMQQGTATEPIRELTPLQANVYESIRQQMSEKEIILLHGVTSSGKTELYIKLIGEQLNKGRQVLYLLPEIALTGQIISRLSRHFGNKVTSYHSKLTDAERIEIWRRVAGNDNDKDFSLVIGARSSLFLPFHDLGLVIIDEEHDSSYKQHEPSPRYHGRDAGIMLASLWRAKTVLGSATPSVETMYNAMSGKYGYASIAERYGKVNLPEILIANTREAYRKKLMVSHFSPQLLETIDEALGKGEQIMLFRNRRGFSPYAQCSECGWIPSCTQCAVNLTYHKEINRLVCHYCGSAFVMPVKCGNCGNLTMVLKGFGTEKLEEEIKIVFPAARVARMDQDSTRGKTSASKIISSFENGETDILIGTQMIAKGLDFENLTVVGIMNADGMLNFPDFRAHERAFQMMAQVSGRAGRRQKHGRVIIQTSDPDNKVIRQVMNNDYKGMYEAQLEERRLFNYPPFCRLIKISLKHKDRVKLNEYSMLLGKKLRETFGTRVLGPEFPPVSRIQLWYIKNIIIKIEKEKPVGRARELIGKAVEGIEAMKGTGSLRINIDVDAY